ncbi:FAD-dependent oxidoreductase [Lacticaseibacillus songhuajiangensis]|jgi:NADPH-dependent 2,4-dienoyl-CoA reductase/sulfur reductase-like enzyme/rhodanese-related sulfurtransferase|uniref:FAD-dependent oxidoreductase n=1 Tax=Lacticaseibacillus songhuajiangensis TaxID=1296539 RepID=UPI000F7A8AAE|nr:FAD-dependent oxidoreductase [Lacticaseibacillus songhuajiangensis]
MTKYLIVGGVAAGMSAATRLRRLQEDAEIIVFERGPHVSFANCGLPYYLGGEITDRDALLVQTPAKLKARFNLDVRENTTVTAIDAVAKTVQVKPADAAAYAEAYDALILAPGAKPVVPPIPGLADAQNVFTLRNIPDMDQIETFINTKQPQSVVVIGAGAIGLEMTESLVQRGLDVTLVDAADHVLPALDIEMAPALQTALTTHGVHLHLGAAVAAIGDHAVTLKDGQLLPADMVLMSVGVKPETTLAQAAGIKLDVKTGGITVDAQYQTSVPDIYAVGDAITVTNQLTGQPALISLASPANRQGRQVADILSGVPAQNHGGIGTAIVRVFDQVAATTGLNERQAQNAGLNFKMVHLNGKDHAAYYPGAVGISLKLLFDAATGQLYGAQAVGPHGVDKRIDVLATAIKAKMTVFDLEELELSYAPPFGVAKDSVNMLGYAGANVVQGLTHTIQWHELAAELAAGKQLLDVREPDEFAGGHFKGAINIPLDALRERLDELDPQQAYIVSCQSGLRSYNAERLLRGHGFTVQNLDGAIGLAATVIPDMIIKEAAK